MEIFLCLGNYAIQPASFDAEFYFLSLQNPTKSKAVHSIRICAQLFNIRNLLTDMTTIELE